MSDHTSDVMAGLVPAIHVFIVRRDPKTWMPPTSAGMTTGRRQGMHMLFVRCSSASLLLLTATRFAFTASSAEKLRVGKADPEALTYGLVSETSRRQGWGPKGIEIAPMGAMPGQIAALKRGDIDGAIMDIGNAFELEKRGEGRILVRFTDIKDFHIHVIFATDKLIAGRPQAVRGFLKGWFETIAFMRKNKPETVAIASDVTHKDAEINSRVYDELMPMFSDDGRFNASALATLAKSYVELQLLPQEPDMAALYTEAVLPK